MKTCGQSTVKRCKISDLLSVFKVNFNHAKKKIKCFSHALV